MHVHGMVAVKYTKSTFSPIAQKGGGTVKSAYRDGAVLVARDAQRDRVLPTFAQRGVAQRVVSTATRSNGVVAQP